MRGRRLRTLCRDCGVDTFDMPGGGNYYLTEYYMVHDHVWAQAGMAPLGGFLCIGCLERRLSRRLTGHDLWTGGCNTPGHANDTPKLAALKLAAWRLRQTKPADPPAGKGEQLSLDLKAGRR